MGLPPDIDNDPILNLLRGIEDEAEAIKDYYSRALRVDDDEVSSRYNEIMLEEWEHLGEFLIEVFKRNPDMKEALLRGMSEAAGKKGDDMTEQVNEQLEPDEE